MKDVVVIFIVVELLFAVLEVKTHVPDESYEDSSEELDFGSTRATKSLFSGSSTTLKPSTNFGVTRTTSDRTTTRGFTFDEPIIVSTGTGLSGSSKTTTFDGTTTNFSRPTNTTTSPLGSSKTLTTTTSERTTTRPIRFSETMIVTPSERTTTSFAGSSSLSRTTPSERTTTSSARPSTTTTSERTTTSSARPSTTTTSERTTTSSARPSTTTTSERTTTSSARPLEPSTTTTKLSESTSTGDLSTTKSTSTTETLFPTPDRGSIHFRYDDEQPFPQPGFRTRPRGDFNHFRDHGSPHWHSHSRSRSRHHDDRWSGRNSIAEEPNTNGVGLIDPRSINFVDEINPAEPGKCECKPCPNPYDFGRQFDEPYEHHYGNRRRMHHFHHSPHLY